MRAFAFFMPLQIKRIFYLCLPMMKRLRTILIGVALLAAFSSCRLDADDIRLEEVYGVETLGTTLSQSRVNIRLGMANDSNVKITVREANLRLHSVQNEILELVVEEPVVLTRRSMSEITLPLTIRFRGGLGALTAIPQLTRHPENILVSGIVRLKGGGVSKRYELKEVPLPDFLRLIGLDPEELDLSI